MDSVSLTPTNVSRMFRVEEGPLGDITPFNEYFSGDKRKGQLYTSYLPCIELELVNETLFAEQCFGN